MKFLNSLLTKLLPSSSRKKQKSEKISSPNLEEILNDLRHHLSNKKSCTEKPSRDSIVIFGKTLGTGTFGRVRIVNYSANIKKDPYVFALKIIHWKIVIEKEQKQHVKDEIEILKNISHPFIVKMYGYFYDQRSIYILMEYVLGGELFSKLRKEYQFSRKVATFYAAEIVLAFEYLHEQNIIYRDLKTENILIGRDGHIKLVDFGFAKYVEGVTKTLCGTAEYLAPETLTFNGYGKQADWWAVGILIYEMLMGESPYHTENVNELYDCIMNSRLSFPDHIDKNSIDIIQKFLQVNPRKRLGYGENGMKEIKRHPFFRKINWKKLYKKKISPPYIPKAKGKNDTGHFEDYSESFEQEYDDYVAGENNFI